MYGCEWKLLRLLRTVKGCKVSGMRDTWGFPGSRWWKFDFHVHTPESDDYGRGDDSLKNISHTQWLRKAMEAGLDCVAVTDHNSGGWLDGLKSELKQLEDLERKPGWYRDLVIFPGVEITVADSGGRVHLLAVFDPDHDSRKIFSILGASGITKNFGDPEKTSTTKGFCDTVEEIVSAGGLAIAAHIDKKQGLLEGKKTLTPELEKSLQAITAGEFCDLHAYDHVDPSLNKKVDSLAKIAGSDAHTPDEIGRYFSWIKMSQPSLAGLRLALMDHEFCVRNQEESPNQIPDNFLTKLTIRNMQHCGRIGGRPFILPFHPHFNAVIGGRGTGKSTVLESIRIASRRDQNLGIEAPRVKEALDKFMSLVRDKGVMLEETEIILELHRHGKDYQLLWRQDGEGSVLNEYDDSSWKEAEPGDLKERFPLSIFSQKQIDELASNPRGLLSIIDRTPEVNYKDWKARWESAKSQFIQLRERKRDLLRHLDGEKKLRVDLVDVERDLKQYEEKGHGAILKNFQNRSQQKNSLPDDHVFQDLSNRLLEFASSVEISDFPKHLFDDQDETTAEIKSIHDQSAIELNEINQSIRELSKRVSEIKERRSERMLSSAWYQSVQESMDAYKSLVKEYEDKKSSLSLSLYGEWVQKRNHLVTQLKNLDAIRTEAESTETQITESLSILQSLRGELLEKRRRFIQSVIGENTYVRMDLVPYGDMSSVEDDYRSLLDLGEFNFRSSVYEQDDRKGILWELCNWEEENIPDTQIPHLLSQVKSNTWLIAEGKDRGNHGKFDNRLKTLLENKPSAFDQLDAWWPEDMLRVKYSKGDVRGKFDDLEKGSAGQKAAAILAFLLSYGNEPLIIDQPEDDLDNALISDLIVTQIQENKNNRQLIIVTHNPNIVVNGDSELVSELKFDGGLIQVNIQGGLEESGIREAICTIMEGGKIAFDKRYARIRGKRKAPDV